MLFKVVINILLFYAILILVNIPAPFLGLNFENNSKNSLRFAPPDFVIPIVWFVLFTLLGIAHYLVAESVDTSSYHSYLIVGLGVLCAAYDYYTLGLAAL